MSRENSVTSWRAGLHAYRLDIQSASIDGIPTTFELKTQLSRQTPINNGGLPAKARLDSIANA